MGLNLMLGKRLRLALICLFILISASLPLNVFGYQFSPPFKLSCISAMLMDATSGQIIYSQNPYHHLQPASLAKLMTLFLIFDALDRGNVKLNDEILISKTSTQKEGSTMYLSEGEKVPLVELIKGIAIVSGNDACVAVAEGIFESEQNLVDKMNQKLRNLNLQNSHFQTVDGWPASEQYTTAYDMMMLAHAYIQEHPEALQYHKLKEFTHADILMHNRNGLIFQDPSADGLKTGHVEESGYHLIATAERENRRYIAVIMGADKIETREKEAMQLLDLGFNNFITLKLFSKDDILSHLTVLRGTKGEVGLRPSKDGVITIPIGQKEFISYEFETPVQQKAPIKTDQKLGQVIISYRKEIMKKIPLVANEDIQQASTKMLVMQSVRSIVVKHKYMLLIIFILFCVLLMLYLYIRKIRQRSKKIDPKQAEIVRQRLEKILKSNETSKTDR